RRGPDPAGGAHLQRVGAQPRRGVRVGPDPAASPTRVAASVPALAADGDGPGRRRRRVGGAGPPVHPQRPPHRPSPCRPAGRRTPAVAHHDGGRPSPDFVDPQPSSDVTVSSAETFDPFGGGDENDALVENLLDGDTSTQWRTETYLDPLPLLKPGVGIRVEVTGTPRVLELIGLAPGASFEIRWAPRASDDLDDYEV